MKTALFKVHIKNSKIGNLHLVKTKKTLQRKEQIEENKSIKIMIKIAILAARKTYFQQISELQI